MSKIEDLYKQYLIYMQAEDYASATIYKHEMFGRRAIVPALGTMNVEELKLHDYNKIKVKVRENFQGNLQDMHRRAMIVYRRFLRFAAESEHQMCFHWKDVPLPRKIDREPDSLTIEEIQKIFDELNTGEYCDLRLRALFEILLRAGLRISEALALDIKDLDLDNEEIHVQNVKTKKMNWLGIPGCSGVIEQYLDMRNDNHPALFVTNPEHCKCRRMDKEGAKTTLRRFKKRVKLSKPLTFHIWRRTFCTMLLQKGIDIKSVQWLARHESPSTTMRYYIAINKEKAKGYQRKVFESSLQFPQAV